MTPKLLREPLVQFLALGAVLFGIDAWTRRPEPSPQAASGEIVIDAARVASLRALYEQQWRRPPTEAELRGTIEDEIREEVLAREAREIGLAQDDAVIRRRLAQKMQFLTEDVARLGDPTDEDLRRFHAENPALFARPGRVSFEHVFFSKERRGEKAAADVADAIALLSKPGADASRTGDPFLLECVLEMAPLDDVENRFGKEFADAVAAVPAGSWQGPVESAFGLHAVLVAAREPGRARPFEEARAEVLREYGERRRTETNAAAYAALRGRWKVTVDDAAIREHALAEGGSTR
jgi:peptidyl-prolyl cis-trans isomerase C